MAEVQSEVPGDTDAPGSGRRRITVDPFLVVLMVLVVLPIITVVIQLHAVSWYPTGDLAQAELRMIRFFDHPPLVGAAGRIVNSDGVQGNHPGPAMFWGLWPLWALLGGSSWAFAASTAALNLVAAVVSIWLAFRRLGRSGALLWSLCVAALIAGFGLDAITQAWNPWVALLAFAVFLMAVWGYLDGEGAMLAVAVAAGSWCLQAHVGYIVPVPLLLGAAVGYSLLRRRVTIRSVAAAVVVGAVMWTLPIYQQLTRSPGNLSIIYANFTNPKAVPFGFGTALRTAMRLLNPTGAWVRAQTTPAGSVLPGILVGLVWLGCVVVCVGWGRRPGSGWSGDSRLLTITRLHAVVGVGFVAGVVAISRVFGEFYIYTFRWVVVVTAAMFLSILATVGLVIGRTPALGSLWMQREKFAALGVVGLLVLSVSTAYQFSGQEIPYGTGWKTEARLAPKVLAQLDRTKRYHVGWDDPVSLGGLGFGLMLAADRDGFTVQTDEVFSAGVEPERVGTRSGADAELHVVTGPAIRKWERAGVGRRLAYVDIRTPAQKAAFTKVQRELFDEIRAKGLRWTPDTPMFLVMGDPHLSAAGHRRADRLIMLGQPTAVYLTAPGVSVPDA